MTVEEDTDTYTRIGVHSEQAILSYPQFNIPAGTTLEFHHYVPSPQASVLARVVGGDASTLAGSLLSNGWFFLVNAAGIHITDTARINVAGLVASTLNIGNDDFLHGRWQFERNPQFTPGAVINEGNITASPGGLVALLGGAVANRGSIVAELGHVALAGADKATLAFDQNGWLAVTVDRPIDQVATGINGAPVAAAIEQSGTITAPGGQVLIRARALDGVFDDLVVLPAGVVEANHVVERNGRIELVGEGGAVRVGGALHADGTVAAPDGGQIRVEGSRVEQTGVVTANAQANGQAGSIELLGHQQNVVAGSARVEAVGTGAGSRGGEVRVLGDHVGLLDAAHIDASGDAGGGTVLVGGDYQGGPGAPSAWLTIVGSGASISADANSLGNGGRVIVWSDDITQFNGSISARGGANGGRGGFAEVSGKEHLQYRGTVDLSAADGSVGDLLLDPATITLVGGNGDGSDPFLKVDRLQSSGGGADGIVLLTDAPSAFTIFESELEGTSANLLLQASNGVNVSGTFIGGQVLLKPNRSLTIETRNASGLGDTAAGIDLTGSSIGSALEFKAQGTGSITLHTGTGASPLAAPITVGKLSTESGNIVLDATGAITVGGPLTTTEASGSPGLSGSISLLSRQANVAINSDLRTGDVARQDVSGNQTSQSGAIAVTAATSIAGSGQLRTGDSSLTGVSATGIDQAITGGISLTAGTGGATGGIALSNPSALRVGAAARTGAANATDTTTSGNIVLTSIDSIGDGLGGALQISNGGATGGFVNQPGSFSATTTGSGAGINLNASGALQIATMHASNGSIAVTSGGALTVSNGSVVADGVGQDVTLTVTSGDMIVGRVQAAHTVTLTATAGRIEELGNDPDADVLGQTVNLSAGTGIGTLGALETDMDTLNLTTGSGGAALHDLGSFTLNPVTIAGGSLSLTADGTLQVAPLAVIQVGGTGTLTLIAGAGGVGSLIVPEDPSAPKNTAGASLKSSTGNITLHDAGGMDIWRVTSKSGNLDISSGGSLTLRDNVVTGGSGQIRITAGDALVTKWFLQTDQGDVSFNSASRLDLLRATSLSGSIGMTAGQDIIIRNSVVTGGAGSITGSANDSITLQKDSLVRTTGTGNIALHAGLDGTGQILMDTNAAMLSQSGNITLDSPGQMSLWRIGAVGGNVSVTSGQDIALHGMLTDDLGGGIAVHAKDGVTIDPNQVIRVLGTGGLTMTAGDDGSGQFITADGVTLQTDSGPIVLTSADDLRVWQVRSGTGPITLTSHKGLSIGPGGAVTGGTAAMTFSANNALTLEDGALVRQNGTGPVSLTAGADGIAGALIMAPTSTIESNGGSIAISTASDLILGRVASTSGAINVTSSKGLSIHRTITTSGGIALSANDALTLENSSSVRSTGAGAVSLTAGADGTGEMVMLGTAFLESGSGPMTLKTGLGDMTLRRVAADTGAIHALSGKALIVQDAVTTGGADGLDLTATDAFTIEATGSVRATGAGSILVIAGTDGTGSLQMLPGSFVQSLSGSITLAGLSDATLGQVTSTSGDVKATSGKALFVSQSVATGGAGSIQLQANDLLQLAAGVSVKANGTGGVSLLGGADGTGLLQMLDSSFVQTGSGAIALTSHGDADLWRATSASGPITVFVDRDARLHDVLSTTGNINVTANDSLTIVAGTPAHNTGVRTTGTGTVQLAAGTDGTGALTMAAFSAIGSETGAITLTSPGDLILQQVTSTSGDIKATSGKALAVEQAVTTGGAGSVALAAKDAVTIDLNAAVRALGSGSVAIDAGTDGTGSLTVLAGSSIQTVSGLIHLSSPGVMTLDQVMSTSGALDVVTAQDLFLNNTLTTGASTGITLNEGGPIVMSDLASAKVTGPGALTIHAGTSGNGGLVMSLNAALSTETGTLSVSSTGDMTLGRVSSTSGPILLQSGKAATALNTIATGGAGTLTLSANDAITLQPGSLLRTTGTGALKIAAGIDGIGGDLLMQPGSSIFTVGAPVVLTSPGAIELGQVSSTTGPIAATAGTSLLLHPGGIATAGPVTLTANNTVTFETNSSVKTTGAGAIAITSGADGIGGDFVMQPNSTIESINGPITLTSATDMTLWRVSSAGGNITITSNKAATALNVISAGTAGGAGNILFSTKDLMTLETGSSTRVLGTGTLTLNAGTDGSGLLLMNGTALLGTQSGLLQLTSADDMGLAQVVTTGGNLNAFSGGSLLVHPGGINVGGAGLLLLKANNDVRFDSGTLTRATGTGTVTIIAGADGIGGDVVMAPDAPVSTVGGLLSLSSAGDLTMGQVTSTSGNIQAVAGKSLHALGTITTGSAGTIALTANNLVDLATGSLTRTNGAGTVTVIAGADGISGDLAMAPDAQISTVSGLLSLSSATDLTTGQGTSTSGNIQAVAGKSLHALGTISTGSTGTVTLTANDLVQLAANSFTRTTGTGAIAVTAGADGTGALQMDSNATVQTISAPIAIHSASDASLWRVSSTSGVIDISSSKGLSTHNTISTGGAGTVHLAANDTVTLDSGTFVRTTGTGAVTIEAGTDGTGDLAMTDGTAQVQTAGTPITITSPGDMILQRISSTSGSIAATAGKSLTTRDTISTGSTGSINLSAGTIVTLDVNSLTRVNDSGTLTVASGGSGAGSFFMNSGASLESNTSLITVTSPSDMTLWRLSSSAGGIQATAGKTLTVKNTLVSGGAAGITATSNDVMSLDPNVVVRSTGIGNISLHSGLDGTGDFNMGNSSSVEGNGGGNITLQSGTRMELRKVTATTGNISLTSGGDLIMPNTVSTTGAGVISATAGQNLKVRLVQSQTPIVLTATAGAIDRLPPQDPLGDGTNVIAPSVTMNAATGIGTGLDGPMQTSVDTISATVSGLGDIRIAEVNAVTLDHVAAANGSVTITAGGPITVNNGSLTAGGLVGNVSLTTTSGDLLVGHIDATGQATLTAAGSILELGSDPDVDLSAASAVLSAGGAIGASANPLEISVTNLQASATSGGIYLTEQDGASLNSLTASGDIDISSVAGDLLIGSLTAGGGVHLNAITGSLLDQNGAAQNISAGADSTLRGGGTVGTSSDPLDVAVTGTLGVAASASNSGVSVNIAGTVSPLNMLAMLNTPPGNVVFNGDIVYCANSPCN